VAENFVIADGVVQIRTNYDRRQVARDAKAVGRAAGDETSSSFTRTFADRLRGDGRFLSDAQGREVGRHSGFASGMVGGMFSSMSAVLTTEGPKLIATFSKPMAAIGTSVGAVLAAAAGAQAMAVLGPALLTGIAGGLGGALLLLGGFALRGSKKLKTAFSEAGTSISASLARAAKPWRVPSSRPSTRWPWPSRAGKAPSPGSSRSSPRPFSRSWTA
jgi:hypothetical protein